MQARQFNMNTVIRANAAIHADRLAMVDGALRITHRELGDRIDRLAQWLSDQGIARGDRVALLLLDSAPFMELMLAAGRIGAIAVTLNWRLTKSELAYILENSAPALLLHNPRFADLVTPRPDMALFTVEDSYALDQDYHRIATDHPPGGPFPDLPGDLPLYMMYTSGTTGRPKGCLQSNNGTAAAALAFVTRRALHRDDRLLSTNPIFHVAGLSQVFSALAAGGSVVFPPRDADPAAMLEMVLREGCTMGSPVPQILVPWRELQRESGRTLPFRRYTTAAGMGNPARLNWLADGWNCAITGGYGQTEIGGWSTFIDYPEMLAHPRSLGWPLPHLDMAILDDNGNILADGKEGEIALRGPSVMLGYWNNPEASEAALGHGWLRTGDVGRRDDNGLFYLLGRSKELIKTGGENVYPAEVDEVLLRLPAVADVGIAGVKDRKWGEAVKAFIVLKPGMALTRAEVSAWCKQHIAGYKRPRYIEFVERLPRDHYGKLRRRELSQMPVTPDQAAD